MVAFVVRKWELHFNTLCGGQGDFKKVARLGTFLGRPLAVQRHEGMTPLQNWADCRPGSISDWTMYKGLWTALLAARRVYKKWAILHA